MHQAGIASLDKMRFIAVAAKKTCKLIPAYARKNRRIGDLESIQMQDGQNCAVSRRIQELVRMPAGREGARFGFAVAHDARNNQFRIVKRRPIGVRKRVAKLASFMDGSRRFRRRMTGNAVGPRKLTE